MSEAGDLAQARPAEKTEDHPMTRRVFLESAVYGVRNAIIAGTAISIFIPEEAEAGSDLALRPSKYGGYANMISQLRNHFGTREDYQIGFTDAANNSNEIIELPAGSYGILPANTSISTPKRGSDFLVEATGFLHAVHEVKRSPIHDLKTQWLKAKGDLQEEIEKFIMEKYPAYHRERGVFDDIRMPVVTLQNFDHKRLEMFLRIPLPESEEFMRRATGRWNEYDDQSRIRHDVPFDTIYDPGKSVYENIKAIYKDQFEVLRRASRKVKIATAKAINIYNDQARGTRLELTGQQKNYLNDLLGVRGTPNQIR